MKTISVKSHTRKGRIVRAHGRVKKENKAKKKGLELVKALERSLETPAGSLGEHITKVREDEKNKLKPQVLKSGREITVPAKDKYIKSAEFREDPFKQDFKQYGNSGKGRKVPKYGKSMPPRIKGNAYRSVSFSDPLTGGKVPPPNLTVRKPKIK